MKRLLKRCLQWLESPGVHILAVISLIGVIGTTVVGSIEPNPLGFDIEPDSRPIYYDLCLAYLTGYFFHILVVVLPERHKREALMGALQGPLMVIANGGVDMVKDLETIAHCPHTRPITEDHLEKVCMALNDNEAVRRFISIRLTHSKIAYNQLVPYMASLPLELQIRLQREHQVWLHRFYPEVDTRTIPNDYDLRKEVVVLTDKGTTERKIIEGVHSFIWHYLLATKAVHAEIEKHDYIAHPRTGGISATKRFAYAYQDLNPVEYPPTALSRAPLDSFS